MDTRPGDTSSADRGQGPQGWNTSQAYPFFSPIASAPPTSSIGPRDFSHAPAPENHQLAGRPAWPVNNAFNSSTFPSQNPPLTSGPSARFPHRIPQTLLPGQQNGPDSGYGSNSSYNRHNAPVYVPLPAGETTVRSICRKLNMTEFLELRTFPQPLRGKVVTAIVPEPRHVIVKPNGTRELGIDQIPYPYVLFEDRRKSNHVVAFRITSHAGRGCGHKPNKAEHCMIYTRDPTSTSAAPEPYEDEVGMQTIPIEVHPRDYRKKLKEASRLDFGRRIQLDFHTAVFIEEIGTVTPASMDVLQGYVDHCDQEYRAPTPPVGAPLLPEVFDSHINQGASRVVSTTAGSDWNPQQHTVAPQTNVDDTLFREDRGNRGNRGGRRRRFRPRGATRGQRGFPEDDRALGW